MQRGKLFDYKELNSCRMESEWKERGPIESLEKLSMVREITGRKRERVFAYGRYLDILNEGTQPL